MEDIDPKILKTIELAKNYTLENPRPKKHTSLIVRKGTVVSIGTNENRTHPLAKKYGYRYDEVHSELDALLRYRGPKNNLVLVNYRMNRFGDMRMSKPCSKCMAWCAAIFDKIYYTTSKGLVQMENYE